MCARVCTVCEDEPCKHTSKQKLHFWLPPLKDSQSNQAYILGMTKQNERLRTKWDKFRLCMDADFDITKSLRHGYVHQYEMDIRLLLRMSLRWLATLQMYYFQVPHGCMHSARNAQRSKLSDECWYRDQFIAISNYGITRFEPSLPSHENVFYELFDTLCKWSAVH